MPATTTIIQFFQQKLIFLFLHPLSLVSLLLFLFFVYKWISPANSIPKRNTPPSPPRLPIFGNLHQLGMYPYRSLRTLSQKYGDLMLLHLGSKPTIVVSSAQVASQILKTHDLIFASRPRLSVLTRLLANGNEILSSPYGEYWRQMRSICVLRLLSNKMIRSFRSVREEEVTLVMKNIQGMSMVNLSEIFISLTNDVICRVAFGKKYREEEGGIDFTKLFKEFTKLLGGFYIRDFISWLAWIDRINGVNAKVSKVSSIFDDFLERIIQEHLALRRERNGDGEEKGLMAGDFVDVLLEAQMDDTSGHVFLDKESIKGLILDMFSGGTDTTSVVLEWIMSELLRNKRVMTKLEEEVKRITGDKKMVTEDDLEKMAYLKAVIKETLRLHPPAPLMAPHESIEDAKINGYDIAAGTHVIVNVWSISRDPAYWDEPEKFYPERFLDSPIDYKGQNFQFIPFGSGRRGCPGMTFAISNIELVIANLLYQFNWTLPNGTNEESLDMTEVAGLSIHKKNPLLAIPTPRFC